LAPWREIASRKGAKTGPDFFLAFKSPNVLGSRLSEKLADHALLFLIFNTSEQLRAEPCDCLWLVERQVIVDFASRKMAGLTSRLKDWPNLSLKVGFFVVEAKEKVAEFCAPALELPSFVW
jgi:hypothetical protein